MCSFIVIKPNNITKKEKYTTKINDFDFLTSEIEKRLKSRVNATTHDDFFKDTQYCETIRWENPTKLYYTRKKVDFIHLTRFSNKTTL